MREYRNKHGGLLKVLEKGETANPNGRPRKFVSLLKEQGYKLSEINDSIKVLMSMTMEELADVWKNPKATVLEKTVANSIRKGIENGKIDTLETLISRIYGKPKETIDQTTQTIVIKQGGSKRSH